MGLKEAHLVQGSPSGIREEHRSAMVFVCLGMTMGLLKFLPKFKAKKSDIMNKLADHEENLKKVGLSGSIIWNIIEGTLSVLATELCFSAIVVWGMIGINMYLMKDASKMDYLYLLALAFVIDLGIGLIASLDHTKKRCKAMIMKAMSKTWAGWFAASSASAILSIIRMYCGGSAGAVIDLIDWFLDDGQGILAVVPLALKLALSGPVSICGCAPFGGKVKAANSMREQA